MAMLSKEAERRRVLVIYDIADDRRRRKMVKCLERYGGRVQHSAFEAVLQQRAWEEMAARAATIIREAEDSLRVYVLRNGSAMRTWGKEGWDEPEKVMVL